MFLSLLLYLVVSPYLWVLFLYIQLTVNQKYLDCLGMLEHTCKFEGSLVNRMRSYLKKKNRLGRNASEPGVVVHVCDHGVRLFALSMYKRSLVFIL